ncbi:MAG: hypothetical protein KBT36_01730 [Kurthia sp.]|nr:hypothetical protein [Candidatus Kurthia equi]
MKALLRILVLLALALIALFYVDHTDDKNEPLKGPTKPVPNTEVPQLSGDVMERPKEGWSTYVGKKIATFQKELGEPQRKGPSAYGFTWWVYNQEDEYILVGVEKGKINQLFVTGEKIDLAPFKLGQTIDELYRNTITDTEINVTVDNNIYTMILSEIDLQTRLLVMYKDVLAQLYFDGETKKLTAIRFIDGETLVKQKPYDMTYVGEVLEPKKPSSFDMEKINNENAQQLFELSNIYRQLNGLPVFEIDPRLSVVTQEQVEGIVMERIAKSDAPETELESLLKNNDIPFEKTSENLAEEYADAAEAVSGFMNSESHRKDLLNEDFNKLGTGAFETNFAQIFIKQKEDVE